MTFTHFQFLYPGWLLLLPVTWAFVWQLWRSGDRDSMWNRVCDLHLLQRMRRVPLENAGKQSRYWILGLMFSLGIVAAAGPSWSRLEHDQSRAIPARVVLLELSRAMLVEDVSPDRFRAALDTAREILDTEFSGETGLVVFAGAAFVVSPLSRDANALHAFLDALDPSTMPLDGGRIDLGLRLAGDLLAASPGGTGQIIVIGATADRPETALQAALALGRQGNTISVLVVGNDEGGPLKDPAGGLVRDGQGKFVISKPDLAVLQGIADLGNGQFVKTAESPIGTGLLIRETASAAGSRDPADVAGDYSELANDGYWVVWLMLPFCLLLFRRNQLWLLLLVCALPLDQAADAASLETFWQHRERLAHDAFASEDYARTLELSRDPNLRGSALYRQGHYQEALAAFGDGDTAASHYNRGNVLAHLNRFAEAILAFEHALQRDPAHEPAVHNKRLLEYYLEQQARSDASADADQSDESGDSDSESVAGEARIGVAGEQFANPGENSESSSGLGVSRGPGQVDLSENYTGSEQRLERFAVPGGAVEPAQADIIESWIRALPQASSELYRRKFLRDYQRQTRQER